MQRNFMNYNEVFPILDLIGRVQNKKKGHVNFNQQADGDGSTLGYIELPVDLRVVKMDIERDELNPVMAGVIIKLKIKYENGATAELDIYRGLNPPVSPAVDEADFINAVMITGLKMKTKYQGMTEIMELAIRKENGYGTLLGIDVTWNGSIKEVINLGEDEPYIPDSEPQDYDEEYDEEYVEDPDYDELYDNPDDFFNNGSNVQDDVVVGIVDDIEE